MSKITKIPKEYCEVYKEILNLIEGLKISHEQGKYKKDNYYSSKFLKLWREARDLEVNNYEYEQWTLLHREISFCTDIEMFPLFEAYDIEIPDPTGEMREKYRWITSEEELYQEVMKYYPKFKELIEKMKNEKN
jgi:hypothetical protein